MSSKKLFKENLFKCGKVIKSCICTAIFMLSFLCIVSTGCRSTSNLQRESTESIIRNQRADAKLEVISADLTELHRDALSRIELIREQSKTAGDFTDRLIFLFGEYESEVNKLLNEIDRIREQAELQSEGNNDNGNSIISDDTDKSAIDDTEN